MKMTFTHSNSAWQRFLMWLLKEGPRVIAHWLAAKVVRLDHADGEAFCWPCEAKARIKYDSHVHTPGAKATIYCPKCGLDKKYWRKWCSNTVEQINYRAPKPPRTHYLKIGW